MPISLKGIGIDDQITAPTAPTSLTGIGSEDATTVTPAPVQTPSVPIDQLPASMQENIKNSGTISAPKPKSLLDNLGDLQQHIASFFGNDNNTKIQDKYQTLTDAGVQPMQATTLAAKHVLDPSKITPDDLKGMTKPQIVALASSFDQASLDRAMNTPVGKILNFTKKVVLEAPARGGMKIALSTPFNPLGDTYNPSTPLDKFLYGDQPIKSVGSTFNKESKAISTAFGGDKNAGKVAGPTFAAAGVVGESILDFLPAWAGGEETLAKGLLEAKTAEEAAAVLTKTGLPEDLISTYAPKFAEAGSKAEVKTGLDSLKNVLETTHQAATDFAPEIKAAATPVIDEEANVAALKAAKTGEPVTVDAYAGIKDGRDSGFRSPIKDVAQSYANMKGGTVSALTHALENPYVTTDSNQALRDLGEEDMLAKLRDQHGKLGSDNPVVKEADTLVQQKLAERGHDSVIYTHADGHQDPEFQVFKEPPAPPEGPKPPVSDLPSDNPTPAEKLVNSLKEAEPMRSTQEASYSAERGSRIGAFTKIGENTSGEQGFFQQLGALKGELSKVDFPSIRENFTQPEIDQLFEQVKSSDLTNFEKATAGKQLADMLGKDGGVLPTEKGIDLLHHVFGNDFVDAVEQMTEGNKSVLQKALDFSANVLQLPKTLVSTMNLHFPLNQGLFLAPSMPKIYGEAWMTEFKSLVSEGNSEAIQKVIESNKWFDRATETGMSITKLGKNMSYRPEEFMSTLLDKIPGVRATGRATMDAGNYMRMNAWASLADKAVVLGRDPANDEKLAQSISDFVNTATNRGKAKLYGTPLDLSNQATTLNALFFSPRKTFSAINLMNPAFYASLDPFVRQQALKSLLAHAGATITILTLASMAGAEVGLDPRSADFGKIKIGDTRIDISGSEQQYIRMAAQLITGQYISTTSGKTTTLGVGYKPMTRLDILTRQLQGKESPVAAFVTDLLKGQQYNGQPLDFKPDITDVNSEEVQRLTPFVYQDLLAIAKSDPNLLPLGAISFFGGMTETYGATAAGGPYSAGGGAAKTSTGPYSGNAKPSSSSGPYHKDSGFSLKGIGL